MNPDGEIQALDTANLDDSHDKAILIVTSIFMVISLLSVILRCFVRTYVVHAWGWDDATMVVAMVSDSSAPMTRTKADHIQHRFSISSLQFPESLDVNMALAGHWLISHHVRMTITAQCSYEYQLHLSEDL